MKTQPSIIPIPLLLTTGLLCLTASMVLPTTEVNYSGPAYAADGQLSQPATTGTVTDPLATTIAVGLIVLAVAALAGAGWQTLRRLRWSAGQKQTTSPAPSRGTGLRKDND